MPKNREACTNDSEHVLKKPQFPVARSMLRHLEVLIATMSPLSRPQLADPCAAGLMHDRDWAHIILAMMYSFRRGRGKGYMGEVWSGTWRDRPLHPELVIPLPRHAAVRQGILGLHDNFRHGNDAETDGDNGK